MLLASVLDNGDARVLADAPGVTDAGTTHALLAQLMAHGPAGDVLVRILTTPDAPALDEALWATRAFSAAGYPVDAIVVTRVPAAGDGWPRAWATAQAERVAEFASTCPVPVIPLRLRPRRRAIPRTMPAAPARQRPIAGLSSTAAGFTWHLPVDGIAGVTEVGVGQDGDRLVVSLDGLEVRRPLPPVLVRCLATDAAETATGLDVAFVRNPELWPEGGA